MIVTVTLNPAIDRILYVPSLKTGEVNRALKTMIDAGGKGINVSKAVKSLGGETIALGFIAGSHGRFIKDNLNSYGIEHHFVEVPGECRVNIKIYCEGGNHTDINEPGFNVSEANFNLLQSRLKGLLQPGNIVVISGSTPPSFQLEYYSCLCQAVTDAGIPLIIDADGDRLNLSLSAKPAFVKLNRREMSEISGKEIASPEDALPGARELLKKGARGVIIALKPNSVLYLTQNIGFFAEADSVEICNTIGAGDALTGAIAHAVDQKMTDEASVKFALSAAMASMLVESSAVAARRDIINIYETVKLNQVF
ncbi:MAG: 1-phosphofructokinase family hexose kinase [Bacillota bacterium]|nr:1-phosphofructokinase family hexose kinase [Bacillota bacterium]